MLTQVTEYTVEVIVVDDGSTDATADIVRSYQQQYTNLRLIQQDNAGLGAARNTGIAHAQSNYIYFCDGDDRVVPNMIQRCLTLCYVSSLDLLLFGASQFTDEQYSGMRTPGILCRNTWSHLTGDQYTQLLLQGKEPFRPEVWCCVVRTAILQQHSIIASAKVTPNYLSYIKYNIVENFSWERII